MGTSPTSFSQVLHLPCYILHNIACTFATHVLTMLPWSQASKRSLYKFSILYYPSFSCRRISPEPIQRDVQLSDRWRELWRRFSVPSGWAENRSADAGRAAHAQRSRHGSGRPCNRRCFPDGQAVIFRYTMFICPSLRLVCLNGKEAACLGDTWPCFSKPILWEEIAENAATACLGKNEKTVLPHLTNQPFEQAAHRFLG